MNTKIIRQLAKIIVCTLSFSLQAQISPVSSYTLLFPPQPQKFGDLAYASQKIELQLRLLDASVISAEVQLAMLLEGNGIKIQTLQPSFMPAFPIQGGQSLHLNGADLRMYFLSDNLRFQGIRKSDYVQSGTLPDGVYRLWFEVYEKSTQTKVSIQEVAARFIVLSLEPPLLNLPQNGAVYTDEGFPQILFQWTPRHLSAVGIVQTEYILEIVQIPSAYGNTWKVNFPRMPKYFSQSMAHTSLMYDISQIPLQVGYQYAYRVRVRCKTIEGTDLIFKNEGYSEIYSFFYKENCPALTYVKAEASGEHTAKIEWPPLVKVEKYHLEYRKEGEDNAWFEQTSQEPSILLSSLESQTTYEVRVKNQCAYSQSEYSPIEKFTTWGQDSSSFWCGKHKNDEFSNKNPLYLLRRFDRVKTNSGFEITIEDVSGEEGYFSGTGYTYIPVLGRTGIKVKFSRIFVNEQYQLIEGVFVALTNLSKL